jgi:hypothetical protein
MSSIGYWYNACRIGGRETNRVNMFATFCECKQSFLPFLQLHHNLWSSNKHNYIQWTLHDQSSVIKFKQLIIASECPMKGCKLAAENMQRSQSRNYALSPPHIYPPCSWGWKLHLIHAYYLITTNIQWLSEVWFCEPANGTKDLINLGRHYLFQ